MKKLVSQQAGFLNFLLCEKSFRNYGLLEKSRAIASLIIWKENLEHLAAQKKGKKNGIPVFPNGKNS